MKLSLLPPEILDLILSCESTPHALRLWKCGDKALNLRLQNGGVTRLILEGIDLPFLRVPRLLNAFHKLRHLKLSQERYHRFCRMDEAAKIIQSLPSCLETLELDFCGADQVFLRLELHDPNLGDFFESANVTDPSSQHETADDASTASNAVSPATHIMDMRIAFPNLRKLAIRNNSSAATWSCDDFELLPPTLTGFTYIAKHGTLWFDLSKLPQTIETLALGDVSIAEPAFAHLPRSLTNLDTMVSVQDLLRNEKYLPSGLENAFLDEGLVTADQFDARYHWPKSLNHVVFPDGAKLRSVLNLGLPSHLTEVYFPQQPTSPLTGADIALLPQSVTDIGIGFAAWDTITAADWPKSVTKLYCFNAQFSPINSIRLPRHLKDLTLDVSESEPAFNAETDSLLDDDTLCASFLAAGREAITTVDAAIYAQLLEEHKSQASSRSLLNIKNLEAIAEGRLFGLPLTITKLNCFSYTERKFGLLTLPPRVTNAELRGQLATESTSRLTLSLPPSLTSLTMSYVDLRTGHDTWMPNFGLQEVLVPSSWKGLWKLKLYYVPILPSQIGLLPRQLRLLHIDDAATGYLSEVDLKLLPPNLTSLRLGWPLSSSLEAYEVETEKQLELANGHQSLENAECSFLGETASTKRAPPSNGCLGLLPRSLTYFDAPLWKIYSSDLANVPPFIQDIDVLCLCRATVADFDKLPRTIGALRVSEGSPFLRELAEKKDPALKDVHHAYVEASEWGPHLTAARHKHITRLLNDPGLQRDHMPSGKKRAIKLTSKTIVSKSIS